MLLTYVFRILCQGSSLHRSPIPHEFHLRIVTFAGAHQQPKTVSRLLGLCHLNSKEVVTVELSVSKY